MEPTPTLQRWQQAFEDHPVASTRAIEKQLRASITNNRERLRAVVGGKYRDLLSTADSIVSLDLATKTAESHISALGRLTTPPAAQPRRQVSQQVRTIAELQLLQQCIIATRRSLAVNDFLRASKLLTIARLLLKSLQGSQLSSHATFQSSLSSLRRTTAKRIDVVLSSPRTTAARIIKAATAHCVLTNASATDAFDHTRRLRLGKLRDVTERDGPAAAILRYTLLSTKVMRTVFGRALSDSLAQVQRLPLLQDLDVDDGDLISDDIRSFSPYFKREPLAASLIASSLQEWSSEAAEIFGIALGQELKRCSTVAEILKVRKDLYSLLLPVYFSSPSGETFFQTIKSRVGARVDDLVSKIKLEPVLPEVSTPPDLWEPMITKESAMIEEVHHRRNGMDYGLRKFSRALEAWETAIKGTLDSFEATQSVRWGDLVEEDDEREHEAASLVKSLVGDLEKFVSSTKEAIRRSVSALEARVLRSIESTQEEAENVVLQLRLVRLMRSVQRAFPKEASLQDLENKVNGLHKVLASKVVERITMKPGRSAATGGMPSSLAFNLLQEISMVMVEVGGVDIWSRAAVREVKSAMHRILMDEEAWNEFDRAYLGCALGVEEDAEVKKGAAAEYWLRTKMLFGVLDGR